ncbi:MAG: hypothetical protein FGM61_08120, partial [Sediminibacterium sp.]|nr:hypothetical protein [Sediminibacterium sp.]
MKKNYSIFILLQLFTVVQLYAQSPLPAIGYWRDHLNYSDVRQLQIGDKLYAATETHVFAIDSDKEYSSYSKVTGLHDVGVKKIGWDLSTEQLLIAFQNSNLDVLNSKGNSINISDILKSAYPGNKSIRNIYCNNGIGYLSTGLGIILVNLRKYEIKDTWVIGNNGNQVGVNGVCLVKNNFFAATEEGLKQTDINQSNPSNFTNWKTISGSNGLPVGPIQDVQSINDQLVVLKNDSILIQTGAAWQLLYYNKTASITALNITAGKIVAGERTPGGAARVIQLNTNGLIEKTFSQPGIISYPRDIVFANNAYWFADQFGGLSSFTSSWERYIPNGPPGIATGAITG